jgi:hypothetical protein
MAYKPQFGVLIPFVLVATQRWTAFVAALLTLLAHGVLATIVLGPEVWRAFAESSEFTRRVVLEQGGTGWEKIQSLFAAVRMWGGGIGLAYAAQFALSVSILAGLIRLWRSSASYDIKACALACACLLATPYVLDYDLMVLGVALAFFVRHGLNEGFQPNELSLLALIWLSPLLARGIAAMGVPLGFLAMIALYVMTLRRAVLDRGWPADAWKGNVPGAARS